MSSLIKRYSQMANGHCLETLRFLQDAGENFFVLCDLDAVGFDPPLPPAYAEEFGPHMLFVLAGYTFESLKISEKGISFEAGFGSDNVGSLVSVGMNGIIRVFVKNKKDENLVLFNRCDASEIFDPEEEEEEPETDSMQAILSNPKNRKIIQNLRKNGKNL